MAKKSHGKKDSPTKKSSFWDNPFGGLFDFNHDGKEDPGELWIAEQMIRDCTKKKEKPHPVKPLWFPDEFESEEAFEDGADLEDALEATKTAWRDEAEDGSEYGLDPEDFESEESYEDALEAAKTAWRDEAEDGSEYGLDPEDFESEESYEDALEAARAAEEPEAIEDDEGIEPIETINEADFPNKRRYDAACMLANSFVFYCNEEYERQEKARCRLIVEHADEILAANYLTGRGDFLYAQAVKEHFNLSVSLPDEDADSQYALEDVLCKIARRNPALSFEVWEWCLATFLPYASYAHEAVWELTRDVLESLERFPDRYRSDLVRYMAGHPDFVEKVLPEKEEMATELDSLIGTALQDGQTELAIVLFQKGLKQAGNDWQKINQLVDWTITWCKNDEELESAESFKRKLLPMVKAISLKMVQDKVAEWETDLDRYICRMEDECDRYAYTRKNAWRRHVPDGSPYDLDPLDFATRQDYLAALEREKDAWREWDQDEDTPGLDVKRFETWEESLKACNMHLQEAKEKAKEQ